MPSDFTLMIVPVAIRASYLGQYDSYDTAMATPYLFLMAEKDTLQDLGKRVQKAIVDTFDVPLQDVQRECKEWFQRVDEIKKKLKKVSSYWDSGYYSSRTSYGLQNQSYASSSSNITYNSPTVASYDTSNDPYSHSDMHHATNDQAIDVSDGSSYGRDAGVSMDRIETQGSFEESPKENGLPGGASDPQPPLYSHKFDDKEASQVRSIPVESSNSESTFIPVVRNDHTNEPYELNSPTTQVVQGFNEDHVSTQGVDDTDHTDQEDSPSLEESQFSWDSCPPFLPLYSVYSSHAAIDLSNRISCDDQIRSVRSVLRVSSPYTVPTLLLLVKCVTSEKMKQEVLETSFYSDYVYDFGDSLSEDALWSQLTSLTTQLKPYDFAMSTMPPDPSNSLVSCLDRFSTRGNLDNENKWFCPRCQKDVCAENRTLIDRLPDTLILQLERFEYDRSGFSAYSSYGARRKINTVIDFPLYGLDMKPWLHGESIDCSSDCVYDLVSICNHSGSASGGHYYCYAKDDNQGRDEWMEYNDSYVHAIHENNLIQSTAYVLFYQRRNTALKSSDLCNELKAVKEEMEEREREERRRMLKKLDEQRRMELEERRRKELEERRRKELEERKDMEVKNPLESRVMLKELVLRKPESEEDDILDNIKESEDAKKEPLQIEVLDALKDQNEDSAMEVEDMNDTLHQSMTVENDKEVNHLEEGTAVQPTDDESLPYYSVSYKQYTYQILQDRNRNDVSALEVICIRFSQEVSAHNNIHSTHRHLNC